MSETVGDPADRAEAAAERAEEAAEKAQQAVNAVHGEGTAVDQEINLRGTGSSDPGGSGGMADADGDPDFGGTGPRI